MCLPKFPGEAAVFLEELHARDEHSRCRIRFLDQHLTSSLGFKSRYPRFHRPDGVNFLLLKEGKLLATIDQFGSQMAANGIDYAMKALAGEKLEGWIKTPIKLATAPGS